MTKAELQLAYEDADQRMKATGGHQYMQVLKVRCVHCGRSPKQKGRCPNWFASFLDALRAVLTERGVVSK